MMNRIRLLLITLIIALLGVQYGFAVDVPGGDVLSQNGDPNITGGDLPTTIRSIAWKILSVVKIVLSGIALIYLVILGVMMIVNSDNPSDVKKQMTQIVYTAIGFIFLNVPGAIYQAIMGTGGAGRGIVDSSWKDPSVSGSVFFDALYATEFRNGIINFLSILIFGVAILMFTWAIFTILTSGTDDGKRKSGRERILWGVIGLISVAFLQAWVRILAIGNVSGSTDSIAGVANRIIALAVFFAGPVVVFFLIFGAYYMITSAGDDGRAKKGKAIIINTFIATLILIGMYTFLNDLMSFRF